MKVDCLGFVLGCFSSLDFAFVRFNMANPTQKLLKDQRTFPIVKLDKNSHKQNLKIYLAVVLLASSKSYHFKGI